MVVNCKGNPLISGKSRLVKYYSICPEYYTSSTWMAIGGVIFDHLDRRPGPSEREFFGRLRGSRRRGGWLIGETLKTRHTTILNGCFQK